MAAFSLYCQTNNCLVVQKHCAKTQILLQFFNFLYDARQLPLHGGGLHLEANGIT
jgi:hypothetical protein